MITSDSELCWTVLISSHSGLCSLCWTVLGSHSGLVWQLSIMVMKR